MMIVRFNVRCDVFDLGFNQLPELDLILLPVKGRIQSLRSWLHSHGFSFDERLNSLDAQDALRAHSLYQREQKSEIDLAMVDHPLPSPGGIHTEVWIRQPAG